MKTLGICIAIIGIFTMGSDIHATQSNRLAKEKSPYLLQHAHNPVDWYPWGEEAFVKAKREDKPIFLSIGYATCHWCHVMERESFENNSIAKLLNENFVSIKVDREERPDVDGIYMHFVQAMTGQGGWPLSVFLTPDKKPFYGGTYYPPEDRWGRPGFSTLLQSIAKSWGDERANIEKSSDGLLESLQKHLEEGRGEGAPLSESVLTQALMALKKHYEPHYGGFGQAPKFPQAHSFSLLLALHQRTDDANALEMVEHSLMEICKGGIYDHIGFGVHRYSTDERWHVPHFEKMLYDQALLVKALVQAYQVTDNPFYRRKAEEILEYVTRDMMGEHGAFYSAEDADSAKHEGDKEKGEGIFYIWSDKELDKILGKDLAKIFKKFFGVKKDGNVIEDPHGEFVGKNILYRAGEAKALSLDLEKARKILFEHRKQRPRPFLDDKVLVDWNGLMIAAFAYAGRIFQNDDYISIAESSSQFILKHMVQDNGRLWHRYREGEVAIEGMLEDYAFFVYGLVELYQASAKTVYLKEAVRLTEHMLQLFSSDDGALYAASENANDLILRQKDVYDGALPSGNSIAADNLLRLARMLARPEWEKVAEAIFKSFAKEMLDSPLSVTQLLWAFDFAVGPVKEWVIVSRLSRRPVRPPRNGSLFLPRQVVIYKLGEDLELLALAPYLKEFKTIEGKPTFYECENYVCKRPVVLD
jgi:uncharacterized protein YyaL (SSP411 family)